MLYHSGWIRILLVCVVVGSLLWLKPGPGWTQSEKTPPSSRLKVATEFPNLTGEKAVEHLKQDGSYDSLAEAMAAARYSVNWVTNPRLPYLNGAYEADNPAQGFTSYFTPEGVYLVAAGEGTPAWFLEMKLQGIGYGDQLSEISAGTPSVQTNRVELVRTSFLIPHPSSLTEWYENSPGGLEQGLTIGSPPGERSEANQLRVAFDLEGTLEARRAADGQAINFYDRAGAQVLSYSQLVVTDAQGQKLPAQMEVASGQVVLEIEDTKAEYPVTIDPMFGQQTKLTASDGAAGDRFGTSVAISGETAVVGAPVDDSYRGSVYVYVRNGTTWSEQQKLTASDGAAFDQFGNSVAISGETVVVGSPGDDIGANSDQGSTYVFVRGGTTWSEQQKLTASDGAASDLFGRSVAISGETVVVGALFDAIGANDLQGSAYVFVRSGTTWSQQQKLTASDGAAGDNFGTSVAISGETVVVGSHLDTIGTNPDQGSAYVFVRNGTTWSQQQKLTASDGAAGDQFGNSVAISGETVAVGVFGANSFQGSAYVYVRSGTTWSQQQKLTASDGEGLDQFGYSVAINEETVVVGAVGDTIGTNANQGSASVYVRSGTTWSEQQKLTASDGTADDKFGFSVRISGETVVVGAFRDDIGDNTDQGSASVFTCTGTIRAWTQQTMHTASDGAANDWFGYSMAISGETAVVGVPYDNSFQGSAYVFVRSGTTWSQQQKLTASDGVAGDQFGNSVAISGETVAVGAPVNDRWGSAYVYVRNGTTWSQQQKLRASDGDWGDWFGQSVAISGETAVVGAYQDTIGASSYYGSAYVFVRSGTTWSQQQKLTASDGAADDWFGQSVAISGETVVVGAFRDDIGANSNQGSAYVFVRSGTTWSQQQKLTASDGAADGQFGWSVAISRETVVVGDYWADIGANTDQGAAYVYVRSGTTWSQQQKLTALDGAADDSFGYSVGISGETVVVGARGDDIGANPDQGSASIFVRSGATWSQQQKLTASDGVADDLFGNSVAMSGDTVIVGAIYDDIGANPDQGSASVFVLGCVTCPTITGTVTGGGTICAGNSAPVTVTVSGGTAPYTVTLSNGGGTMTGSGPTFNFTLSPGSTTTYSLQSGTDTSTCPITGSGSATVMVSQLPTTATVGGAKTICVNGTTTGLGGNTPTNGTGSWSVVSGGSGTFSPNATTPNATFTHTGGTGPVTARWTISNAPCTPDSSADVTITITQPPTIATVGGAQTICATGTTAGLGGNMPTVGTGNWSIDGGGTGIFSPNATTPNATFTHTGGAGPVTLRWSISNSPCSVSSATVTVMVNQPPTTATVGGAKTICVNGTTTGLGGNTPTNGTGNWSVVSGGSGTFSPNATTPNATFTHTGGTGPVTARWTISNAPCTPDSSADVTITITQPPTIATVGGPQTICAGGTTLGLGGNPPTVGTGSWSVAGGGTGMFSPSSGTPNAMFTHIGGTGPVTLQWTISTGSCPDSTALVMVFIMPPPMATTGGAQTICTNGTTAGLGGNVPSVGTGSWSVVSGGSGTFSPNAATPNATFTHTGGTGPVTVRWTVRNVPCVDATADAVITINPVATVNAGPDQGICRENPAVALAASFGGSATSGMWSGGAGIFTPDNTAPNAIYTPTAGEITAGTVTLTFTTDGPGGPCSSISDEVTIRIASCLGLMVADTTNNRIQAFDGVSWKVIGTGTVGSGDGQFRLPEAVTFDGEGRIYVADTGNNRIQWSTDSGASWANFATLGTGLNQVKAPQGLTLDSTGNLYVSDTGNGRVMRFNGGIPGSSIVIATNGTASGQVGSPRGLVVDTTFRLFVTDESNSRILRILNANTTVSATSGTILASSGMGMNQVKNPQGITIDPATGALYVADTGNSRILRWNNANPASATTMALVGSALGQVNRPEGVTVTTFTTGSLAGTPLLIVGDTSNNRIVGRPTGTGGWLLIGTPNNIGTGVGQFRAPSKIQ